MYSLQAFWPFLELTINRARGHMEGGAKRVIVTGPSREVPMYVRGVNFDKYKSEETIVSCGLSLSLFG